MPHQMRVGYGRVSSKDQHLDVQYQQLEAAGCHKIRLETGSGTTRHRPKLQEVLSWIGPGDVLVVCKVDRLARSIADLYWIVGQLHEQGATLEILDQPLDLEPMGGKITFAILGLCAELETSLRRERQLKAAGVPMADLRQRYGLARGSLYRYLAAAPQGQAEAAD
jgi:DNA invertase Pin-like site-specific DNA recombinase